MPTLHILPAFRFKVRLCAILSIVFALACGVVQAQAYKDVHDFGGTVLDSNGTSGADGANSGAGVTFDKAGNMYGTTQNGGLYGGANGSTGGVLWEITAAGTYIDLHDFGGTVTEADGTTGPDGRNPEAAVTLDNAGNMYGTATRGGNHLYGIVWEFTTSGHYLVLHDFGSTVTNASGTSGPDGMGPASSVTFDKSGNIYGTTIGGGASTYYGMVWEISATGAYRDVHDFGLTTSYADGTSGQDGIYPYCTVAFDAAGDMVGTAEEGGELAGGILWKITPSGTYSILHNFSYGGSVARANGGTGPDGDFLLAGVTFDKVGNIYSTTEYGGQTDGGTVWEYTTTGSYLIVHDFGGTVTNANGTSGRDGYDPVGPVAFDSAGNLYGAVMDGGPNASLSNGQRYGGMVWQLSTNLTYTDLHDFAGTWIDANGSTGPDGADPECGVTLDSSGNIYGTTFYGGPNASSGNVWVIGNLPSTLILVSVTPSSLIGGASSTGLVQFSGPVGSGGAVVQLSSSSSAATVPATVTVSAGANSATFPISTVLVGTPATVTITATYGVEKQTAVLAVNPPILSGVSISPSVVFGGNVATGTVTVSTPAPVGGSVVNLSSSSTDASVPVTVTVPAGATSATFNVGTILVSGPVTVSITASQGNLSFSTPFTITPGPALKSITLSPSTVTGGNSVTGTVTLTESSPYGGIVAWLYSTGGIGVPVQLIFPPNVQSVTFTATTPLETVVSLEAVSATVYGVTMDAYLTINPVVLSGVSVSPTSVLGGASATGTITLATAAPTGGVVVNLSSNSSSAAVPASITVPAGAAAATFTITTNSVATTTNATICAKYNGVSKTSVLTINPAGLSSVSVAPSAVSGGTSSIGTVTLANAAPTGGAIISLSSNSPSATVPGTVTVSAGATSATFTVTTTSVSSSTEATITATQGAVTKTAILTINPSGLSSVTVWPTAVVGGTASVGTVTLYSPAPAYGLVVTLSSSSSSATVPASIYMAPGATSATFTVTTKIVASAVNATIMATQGGSTKTAVLTVNPSMLIGLSLSPSTVYGGQSSMGTVTLNGPAAPGGVVIFLSSNSASATTPTSVTVAAGATSASFTITTLSVSNSVSADILATEGATTTSELLNINPALPINLSIAPTSVIGGTSALGAVTLGAPAPAGGLTVTLKSTNTSVGVPSSVTIPAGQTAVSFTVTTPLVVSSLTATITAKEGSSTSSATITVDPAILDGLYLSSDTVVGGNSVTGTVTLFAPAPAGGSVVNLSITGTAGSLPVTVTVPQGATSAKFTITTTVVSKNVSVTVTATQAHYAFSVGLFIHNP